MGVRFQPANSHPDGRRSTRSGAGIRPDPGFPICRPKVAILPDLVRSRGRAVAIELARRHILAAVVVESTFTTQLDVGGYHYPLHPVSLIATQRVDSLWKIANIACLKLFPQVGDPCLFRRGTSIRRCSRCHEAVIRKNRDARFKEPGSPVLTVASSTLCLCGLVVTISGPSRS